MRWRGGLVLLALLAAGTGVGEALTPPTEHVLLVGDSIMNLTGPALDQRLGDDYTVHNAGVNGSGLLTPGFYDWPEHLAEELARTDPDVVVVLFIGNYTDEPDQYWRRPDGTAIQDKASEAFARAWAEQAEAFMEQLAATDAEVIWVLPPPMAVTDAEVVVEHLRRVDQELAERWPQVHLVDGRAALDGPDGEWVAELPVNGGPPRPVRTPDTVHLTAAGQTLMAQAIAPVVRRAVGDTEQRRDQAG